MDLQSSFVIPTGIDHRKGDDLRSGGTCCCDVNRREGHWRSSRNRRHENTKYGIPSVGSFAIFPNTTVQTCVVHLIRHSLKYVPRRERELGLLGEKREPAKRRSR